jgi:hypothetical protein
MLTNGRVNQLRDNSIRDLASMLKETSTLDHTWDQEDTWKLSTTKTLSSRPKMVEELNSGTSINNL